MDYRAEERSRFEFAKELARQIVDDSRQGDGFSLVLMGDPPEAAISDAAFDRQDVLDEIDKAGGYEEERIEESQEAEESHYRAAVY